MDQLLTPVLSFILLYKYAALFVVALVSEIFFILPSNVFILMAGVFSGAGYFNFYLSLLTAGAANTGGDVFVYWLARRYPGWLASRLGKHRTVLDKMRKFMDKAAGPTILLSRLSGSAAVVVDFLSGLTPVNLAKFLIYDLIGNFLTVGVLLYVGFVVGPDWDKVSDIISVVAVVVTVVIAALLLWGYLDLVKRNKNNK